MLEGDIEPRKESGMRVRMCITRPNWDGTSKLHVGHVLKFVKETSKIGVCCIRMFGRDFNDCSYVWSLCNRLSGAVRTYD